MAVNTSTEAQMRAMLVRMERLEQTNIRLEQKMDNTSRNIVTASTIAGGVVGTMAGVAIVACTGCVPAGAGAAKATAIYCGGAAVGGLAGAGAGYITGEVLVNTKLGDKKV